jgi:hypothetical protein
LISRHSDEIGLLQHKLRLTLDLCGHVVSSAYRDPDDVFMHGMKENLKKKNTYCDRTEYFRFEMEKIRNNDRSHKLYIEFKR